MALVKSGDGAFFSIGEWKYIVDARPKMIANLDRFRHTLQQSDGGPADAVSSEAVFETAGEGRSA